MTNANNDAFEKMRTAGLPVDQITEAQKEVLNELSPQEVDTLIRVQQRFAAASDEEVEGYARPVVGGVIF